MSSKKLPKQWRRWIRKAGLKTVYSAALSRAYGDYYLKGHGRYWRVNCNGFMDMSEPFETFDRWANSREESVPMTASNEAEFVGMVEALLSIVEPTTGSAP